MRLYINITSNNDINVIDDNAYIIFSFIDDESIYSLREKVKLIKKEIESSYLIQVKMNISEDESLLKNSVDMNNVSNQNIQFALRLLLDSNIVNLDINEANYNTITKITPCEPTNDDWDFVILMDENKCIIQKGSKIFRPSESVVDKKSIFEVIDKMLYNRLLIPDEYKLMKDLKVDNFNIAITLVTSLSIDLDSELINVDNYVERHTSINPYKTNIPKITSKLSSETNIDRVVEYKVDNSVEGLGKTEGILKYEKGMFYLSKGSKLRWPSNQVKREQFDIYLGTKDKIASLINQGKVDNANSKMLKEDIPVQSPTEAIILLSGELSNGWESFENLKKDKGKYDDNENEIVNSNQVKTILEYEHNETKPPIENSPIYNNLSKLKNKKYPSAIRGAHGSLQVTPDGFILSKGSYIRWPSESLLPKYMQGYNNLMKEIEEMFENGYLDEDLMLTRDYKISSPTRASSLIYGNGGNGWSSFQGLQNDRSKINKFHDKFKN